MKKRKQRSRQELGLGKYDSPLIIQYTRGASDFKVGNIENPFHTHTMQYREWERGFNKAYFDKLKKVKHNEYRERSKSLDKEEVQRHADR